MGLAFRPREDPALGGASTGAKPDDALTTLAKIVPADALAAYVALVAIAPGRDEDLWLFAFFLIGLALAAMFLWISAKGANEKVPRWQWVLRMAAFATYALVISKPLKAFVDVDPRLPHAAVVLITVVAGSVGYVNGRK